MQTWKSVSIIKKKEGKENEREEIDGYADGGILAAGRSDGLRRVPMQKGGGAAASAMITRMVR